MTATFSSAAKAGLTALLFCGVSSQALAQDNQAARIAALEQQIAALAVQVAELKKSTAAEAKDREKASLATVSITAGKPVIASPDGAFTINFHAVSQLDTASYLQDGAPANGSVVGPDLDGGSNFRRARLSIDGKLFRHFDYGMMIEMAGPAQLHEAYVQYSGFKVGDQTLRIRGGAFAPNVGLQDAASQNSPLLLERASVSEIGRNFAAGDRRLGVQIATNADGWLAAFAVTGGKISDGVTIDEQLAYTTRLAATPLSGEDWRLHIGANATYIVRPPQVAALGGANAITLGDRPELRADTTQLITTGAIPAQSARQVGLEIAYQKHQFLVQTEVLRFDVDRLATLGSAGDPSFHGYYADASWLLTGEARNYNPASGAFDAPKIASPFNFAERKWGAWEIAARYSFMDLNFNEGSAGGAIPVGGVRGGEQEVLAGALNWYPNSAVRFGLQYQDVHIDRLNAAGTLQIGQDFQTVALRSQFAF